MQIAIDHDKCGALGACEAEAPELFEVQRDGSLRIVGELTTETIEAAENACAACPTGALTILD